MMEGDKMTIPVEIVKGKIYLIRGQKVLLDTDLAELYGVETKRLNEQVHVTLPGSPLILCFSSMKLSPQV